MTILRDAKGRFASRKEPEPVETEWVVPENVWVRFQTSGGNSQGCGNMSIYSMATMAEKVKGENPWLPPSYRNTPYAKAYDGTQPTAGIPLIQLEAYLRANFTGREYSMTFKRAPREKHFIAYEFMLLLEHKMKDVAVRSGDWYNTNHNPPSHLRSYNLVIPGRCWGGSKVWTISDEDKKVF